MTLQKMRTSEIHATAGIILKRRSCCLANRGLRACGEALAMMAYPVKKNYWAAISHESPLHDEIIFVLDLVPDGSIPIGGTKQIGCGDTHAPRFAPSGKLGRRKCVRSGLKSRTTLVQVPWRDLPEYAIVPAPSAPPAPPPKRGIRARSLLTRAADMPIAKRHAAKDGRGSTLCALPRPRRWDLSSSSGSRTAPRL